LATAFWLMVLLEKTGLEGTAGVTGCTLEATVMGARWCCCD